MAGLVSGTKFVIDRFSDHREAVDRIRIEQYSVHGEQADVFMVLENSCSLKIGKTELFIATRHKTAAGGISFRRRNVESARRPGLQGFDCIRATGTDLNLEIVQRLVLVLPMTFIGRRHMPRPDIEEIFRTHPWSLRIERTSFICCCGIESSNMTVRGCRCSC